MRYNTWKQSKEGKLLAMVWQMTRGNHAIIILAMIVQILLSLFPAGITYYVQLLATDRPSFNDLFTLRNLSIVLGVSLLTILLKQSSSIMQGYAMAHTKRNVESRYIRNLSRLTYAKVHDGMDNRNVLAITKESDMLTALIPMIYRSFIQAPVTILAFFILTMTLSVSLTLTTVALIVIVIFCSLLLRKMIKGINQKLFNRYSDLHQIFADWLRGYKVIIFYNALGFMQKNLLSTVEDTCYLSKKLIRIHSLQTIVIETMTYGVVVLFLYLISMQETPLKWQTFISFPTAFLFIRNEAIKISKGYVQLASTESAVRRLTDMLTGGQPADGLPDWNAPITKVEFRDISFSYENSRPILSQVSWSLHIGELHVLSGESGAGKTTCFDLLAGLRQPDSGDVLFNGLQITHYSSQSLLKRIAYVAQEPFILEGSFLDNFSFGNQVDRKKLLAYCNAFRLTHLVGHDEDLERLITGNDLSVGEKQRIAFIRALLKSPDIILLDEMTSNVDMETSQIMFDCMKEIAKEKIVVCITHDQPIIDKAVHITVLRNGKLYEQKK